MYRLSSLSVSARVGHLESTYRNLALIVNSPIHSDPLRRVPKDQDCLAPYVGVDFTQ